MPGYGLHYFLPQWISPSDQRLEADVCVYGATASGVIAAVAAMRAGKSAILLHPGHTLGGMTSGGLGCTDFGKKAVIGGMSRQFYRDLGAVNGKEEEWMFAPHVAQEVLERYIKQAGVAVHTHQFLDAVEIADGRIASVRMLGGLIVKARMFIDATYEGDLMAKAGVRYTLGREANGVYGETINGVQVRAHHQFSHFVDPYIKPGDPSSGTLPYIEQQDAAPNGSGDFRLQAYNFRVCMTDDPKLKVAWEKPADFRDLDFELVRRWFNAEMDSYNDQLPNYDGRHPELIKKFDVLGERTADGHLKTDTNNHGAVSSDFIGANYCWPEADYARREQLFQAHVKWQKGVYWVCANDPAIPERYRKVYSRFGLASDEFVNTGHWPHQIYVREARRMVSDYVLNEHDTQHHRQCDDAVGMGSYNMDSHNCRRFIRDGRVMNEGDVQLPPAGPYRVSYRSIVPGKGQCANLIVPVCLSSSHIAYGSVRMEPVFMVLGESAAIAAHLCIEAGCTVQELPYAKLEPRLAKANQVLRIG